MTYRPMNAALRTCVAVVAAVALLLPAAVSAQLFGNGPKLDTMRDFTEGKFQFATKFDLGWYHVVKWRDKADPHVARVTDITGRAILYMPKETAEKAPALVLIHHSGGLYFPDGRARPNFP